MEKHLYRITVEHLGAPHGEGVVRAPLRFDATNRDNLFRIVEYLKQRAEFTPEQAEAFGVGLKLFGEVLQEQRELPLFQEFIPQFSQFMKTLKKGAA